MQESKICLLSKHTAVNQPTVFRKIRYPGNTNQEALPSRGTKIRRDEEQMKTKQTPHKVNPLYTDTRYNDKIRYSDNMTITKPSLRR